MICHLQQKAWRNISWQLHTRSEHYLREKGAHKQGVRRQVFEPLDGLPPRVEPVDPNEQGIRKAGELSVIDLTTPRGVAPTETTHEVSKATESDAAPAPIALRKGSESRKNRGKGREFILPLTDLPKLEIPPATQAMLPD